MSRVLVTGANGFIGRGLCCVLMECDYEVRAALRRTCLHDDCAAQQQVIVGDIGPDTQWDEALQDVDFVIHLAARVHIMKEASANPQAEFRKVNSAGTMRLAEQAASLGVKRFIYVSSIKVNGEETSDYPFTADDQPNPQDPYSISKAEAEEQLREVSTRMDMDVVIIRPPLVYGQGCKGNFLRLMKLVKLGLPLPFAMMSSKRSMVSLRNLCDLLVRCLESPRAPGETFLISDGMDWSTHKLIRTIAHHLEVPARIFFVPLPLLRLAGRITGQSGVINRLCNSLQVDINKTQRLLDWTPPQPSDVGIRETVEWYMGNRNG
ncbi:MAG: SDR family oxidoreductase [Candidatus Electrothrix sp. ATG1]|nr:SDR family oxidoreductase [Candidatus Electrothrix sp. ATG1]